MTREIKFKSIDNDSRLEKILCMDSSKYREFTGLKDKNGKDIYEGDIVHQQGNNSVIGKYGKDYKVFWQEEKAGWYPFVHDRKNTRGYEVIGNIYQNPELIK